MRVFIVAALLAAMPTAQGDVFDRPGETNIETQGGINPPAQAFMRAMNQATGSYRHVFHVRRPPHTVDLWVGSLVYQRLAYTWSTEDGCLFWDEEGVVVQVRVQQTDCRLILSALTNRSWRDLEPKRPYRIVANRVGVEVFAYSSNTYCRVSFRNGRGHLQGREPTTFSSCFELFDGLVGRVRSGMPALTPWTPQ